ncbi:MAG: tetratricopeptide repeat protein [Thiohalomonadales bacterium]
MLLPSLVFGSPIKEEGKYRPGADNLGALQLFSRGNTYLAVDDYKSAIRTYSKAIIIDPNNSSYYFYRGFAHGSINLYENALQDYDRAIVLGKNDEAVYNNRGAIFAYLLRYQEAIADYDTALSYSDDTVAASMTYFNRGNAYYAQKQHVLALKDYKKANQLNPKQLLITNALVWMYATSINLDVRDPKRSAILSYEILNTGNPIHMDTVAASLASTRDFETAIILTNAALSISKVEPTENYVVTELTEHLALYKNKQAIYQ